MRLTRFVVDDVNVVRHVLCVVGCRTRSEIRGEVGVDDGPTFRGSMKSIYINQISSFRRCKERARRTSRGSEEAEMMVDEEKERLTRYMQRVFHIPEDGVAIACSWCNTITCTRSVADAMTSLDERF